MKFDDGFDQSKSESTKKDRGIDFIEARELWNDSEAVTIPAKNVEGEVRRATVGMIGGKLWVAIWTLRDGKARIISVRRAEGTPFERAYYG